MEPLNKEKRIKREIANSNERRRMQSINAGFQKLKRLLPVNDGEKISKANILQHAADFITSIERDRIILAEQNTLLRRILLDLKGGKIDIDTALTPIESPTPNSLLSVPLRLTMAQLESQDSTPTSTPTPTPAPSTPNRTTNTHANTNTNNNNNNNNHITNNNNNTSSASTRNNNLSCNTTSTTIAPSATVTATTMISEHNQIIGSVAEIVSDKNASPKNGLPAPSGVAAKAAIALPLEVPYTSEVIIKSHSHHPPHHHHQQADDFEAELMLSSRKILKTSTTAVKVTTNLEPQESVSKGQNLDTICKAIMEIEGGRVFKNEK